MFKKLSESYFWRIFLSFFLLSTLIAISLAAVLGFIFQHHYESRIREQSLQMTRQIAETLGEQAASFEEALRGLAERESIRAYLDGEDARSVSIARELYAVKNRHPLAVQLAVLRAADWAEVATNELPLINPNAELGQWGVFRRANESAGMAVYTAASTGILNPEGRIFLARAVRAGDGVLGYVLLSLPRAALQELFNQYGDAYQTPAFILNRSGSVIFHQNGKAAEGFHSEDRPAESESVWSGPASAFIGEALAYSRVDALGLAVVRKIPVQIARQVNASVWRATALALFFAAVLEMVASHVIAGSISRPVLRLRQSMEEVRRGNLHARVSLAEKDEIGQLGDSFNAMLARIERLVRQVEENKHRLWLEESHALSLQMRPHFLYNTLELIKWNAKFGNVKEVERISVSLGRLLRRIMDIREDAVPVQCELEIIGDFLAIQQIHFGDCLSVEYAIDEAIRAQRIPKLILQPLVENAVVHGFKKGRKKRHLLRISAVDAGDYLEFTVWDNGCGIPEEECRHITAFKEEGLHHIGLYNVQARARLLGDARCGLSIASRPGEETRVRLRVRKLGPEPRALPAVEAEGEEEVRA